MGKKNQRKGSGINAAYVGERRICNAITYFLFNAIQSICFVKIMAFAYVRGCHKFRGKSAHGNAIFFAKWMELNRPHQYWIAIGRIFGKHL